MRHRCGPPPSTPRVAGLPLSTDCVCGARGGSTGVSVDGMSSLRIFATTLATITLAAAPSASAVQPDGPWVWPLVGGGAAVVRGFDPPAQPWEAGHRGVDLLGAEHQTVRAAGAGIVTYAGPVAGVGVVTVTHGELRTTYQPVRPTVSVGERVTAGDQIGTLLRAGSHCPPSACLHWGLLRGDVYLDPLGLVHRAGRPRLLPLGDRALDPHVPGQTRSAPVGHRHAAPLAPRSVVSDAAVGALAGFG